MLALGPGALDDAVQHLHVAVGPAGAVATALADPLLHIQYAEGAHGRPAARLGEHSEQMGLRARRAATADDVRGVDGEQAAVDVPTGAALEAHLDVGLGELAALRGLAWRVRVQTDARQDAVGLALLNTRVRVVVDGDVRVALVHKGAHEAELVLLLDLLLDLEHVVLGGVDVVGEESAEVRGVQRADGDLGRVLEAQVLFAVVLGEILAPHAREGRCHQQPRRAAVTTEDEPHGARVLVVGRDVEHAGEHGGSVLREPNGNLGHIVHAAQLAEALEHRSTGQQHALRAVQRQQLVVVVGERLLVLARCLRQLRRVAQRVVQHRSRARFPLFSERGVQLVQAVDRGQVNAPRHRVHHKVIGAAGRRERLLDLERTGRARLESR